MTDVDNVFLVVMHSSALGAGGEERALHNQTRNLLRAVDMNAKGARVFRQNGERWEEVVYDSYGDDMGHHPGHDEPFTAQPVEPSIESQLPVATRLSMSDPSLQRMPADPLTRGSAWDAPLPQLANHGWTQDTPGLGGVPTPCHHPKEQRNITEHHEYCMRCGTKIR